MAKMGKYIYGIINSTPHFFMGGGVNGTYSISYQDISAVVSDSEIVDYTHIPKEVLARLLLRHQEVIEKIMSLGYTIIPVRLGTFAQDETEVKEILNKGYSLIKHIFEKISDKIEIDVVAVYSDFTSVLKEIGEEKEIKKLKEKLLSNSKGMTVDDQMKVGVMVKKVLDEKREKHAYLIKILLMTISQDFRLHELMDDRMVANFAFLINKSEQKDFDRQVEGLNTKFHDELNFRCVGPLPPYSFWTLEIMKMQFEEIDWARKKLALNDLTSKDGIKKAYQKVAYSLHPDRNPDIPGMEKEFDEANKAYKILVNYCEACKQTGQNESISFKEEEFKRNSILVKIRE